MHLTPAILGGMRIPIAYACFLLALLCFGFILWLLVSGFLYAILAAPAIEDLSVLALVTLGGVGFAWAGVKLWRQPPSEPPK